MLLFERERWRDHSRIETFVCDAWINFGCSCVARARFLPSMCQCPLLVELGVSFFASRLLALGEFADVLATAFVTCT